MKPLAHILIVVGFCWLSFASLRSQMSTVALISNRYEKLPKQESFTRGDVEQIMLQEWSVCREHERPWIFTPGCLMLAGAVILDRLTRRRVPAVPTI